MLTALGHEQLGEATTVIAGIMQAADQRIVTLRASLVASIRGHEAVRP